MLAYLFLALAVAVRFIPHPWTFTPVAGALLFFGARGSRRFLWVPLVVMVASDVVLTKVVYAYPFVWDHFVTWAWYAAVLWLGTRLRHEHQTVACDRRGPGQFGFVLSWSAILRCGRRMTCIPGTSTGLMTSYTLALPFFRHAVEGDLLFTSAFFATPVVLAALSGAFGKGDHPAAA